MPSTIFQFHAKKKTYWGHFVTVHRLESSRRIVPATLDLSKIDALHGSEANISTRLRDGIRDATGTNAAPVIIDC